MDRGEVMAGEKLLKNNETGKYGLMGLDGKVNPVRLLADPQGKMHLMGKDGKIVPYKGAMPNNTPPPVPSAMPDGTTGTPANSSGRMAEFASRGFTDAMVDTASLPGEAVRAVGRQLGMTKEPYGALQKSNREIVRNAGRLASDLTGINAVTDFGPDTPQTAYERGAYGAGRGGADALTMMVPGGVAAKFAKSGTALQGVGQSMKTQPVLQVLSGMGGGGVSSASDSQLAGLGAALAIPIGTQFTIGAFKKLITPFASQLSNNAKEMARLAKGMGIKLTAGQETGSPFLQTMESTYNQLPFTAKTQGAEYAAQRAAFNRAVLKQAGVDADSASPKVLAEAFRRIGAEFDDLAARTTIDVDMKTFDDIQTVAANYTKRLKTDQRPVVQSYVDDLLEMRDAIFKGAAGKKGLAIRSPDAVNPGDQPTGVQINGAEYQRISSDIKRRARKAAADPDLQSALNGLAKHLDELLERSGGPEIREAWTSVRRRYNNLDTINKSMKLGSQAERTDGNIPFGSFKNQVSKKDNTGFSRGRGPMNDEARVGDFLGSSRPPDSGTARRNYMTGLLTGEPIATSAMALGADPMMMLPAMAAPIIAPKLSQLLYQAPWVQNYLRNQATQPGPRRLTSELLSKIAGAQALGDQTEGTR